MYGLITAHSSAVWAWFGSPGHQYSKKTRDPSTQSQVPLESFRKPIHKWDVVLPESSCISGFEFSTIRLDPSASQAAFAEFPSSGSEDILKHEP